MKTWTVMLIPHDRSSTTQTLKLSVLHLGIVAGLVAVLSFSSAFLLARNYTTASKHAQLKDAYRSLEIRASARTEEPVAAVVAEETGRSAEEIDEIEARLRAEYETSIAAITSELNDLYDMEAKARDITGLAPRKRAAVEEPQTQSSGKGGSPESFGSFVFNSIDESLRPAHVIYGLSRPSADLILQEIRLRKLSFSHLVTDMEAAQDRIERIPSSWPVAGHRGKITSRFGYRRDPFHSRIRHHDGVDIAAKYGSTIVSTAKGRVIYSGFDKFYGNIVRIDHGNGIHTWYAHMSERLVEKGETVSRDQPIGKLGSTGRSTGAHLHYEVHVNGRPADGEKYMD